MIKKIGIKKFGILLIIFFSVSLLFSSCGKKSSSLVGTSSGTSSSSSGGSALSVSGTVNGGLSPISGSSVALMEAGSASSLSTATTNSSGQFTLTIPSSAAGILYVEAVGGSTNGGANNNNIQLLAFVNVGAPSSIISNLVVNELTTSAFMEAMFHFGMVSSAGGTITFTSPANTAAQTNAVAQYNNMVTISGALNTSSTNLTSSDQNSLYFAADALASCVENSGNCSAMMTDTGGASNMIGSLYNLLNNPSETAGLNTLASGMETSTGWSFSSTPTAVSFILPSAVNYYSAGNNTEGIAIDASGNIWVTHSNGNNTVTELNSSGSIVNTFTVGTTPTGIAIDSSGNVWVANTQSASVSEITTSGSVNTISLPTPSKGNPPEPSGIAIDANGNIWVSDNDDNYSLTELNSSGNEAAGSPFNLLTLGGPGNIFNLAIDSSNNVWITDDGAAVYEFTSSKTINGPFDRANSGAAMPWGIAIAPSGVLWVTNSNSNQVAELNSGGTVLNTTTVGTGPTGIAIDSNGDIWVADTMGGPSLTELNSSGTVISTFTIQGAPLGIAIDASGNLWIANSSGVAKLSGVAAGPQFFPYKGPQWPNGQF